MADRNMYVRCKNGHLKPIACFCAEMINILRQQESARKVWLSLTEDHNKCESKVKKLNSERTALETQLKHARFFLLSYRP